MRSDFDGVFQIAYVVPDIDLGVEAFRAKSGIAGFQVHRGMRTPTGEKVDIALAYAGDTMIELIGVTGESPALYEQWIAGAAPDSPARFHHIGMLVDDEADFDRLQQQAARDGLRTPLGGDVGMMRFFYADTVARYGHYMEYIWLRDEGRAFFSAVPKT